MTFLSIDAASGRPRGPALTVDTPETAARACADAAAAFATYRAAPGSVRAAFLRRIAAEILGLGDALLDVATAETALPRARLDGERGRTVAQLGLFADLVEAEGWRDVRIDPALPMRRPLPRPELRSGRIPLGPVAVFGASNFPLAFSTAGGDTAAALAAGCPVVVKGHPAHPETSAMVSGAICRAVAHENLPAGVFSHLQGPGEALGQALVLDPNIRAVGFTGSRRGGLALMAAAQTRTVPIPVFAEMSSVNPVVLAPQALRVRGGELAEAFVQSMSLGVGQFCTNPGLVLALAGPDLDRFAAAAAAAVAKLSAEAMLSPAILGAYRSGLDAREQADGAEALARGDGGLGRAQAALWMTDARRLRADSRLTDEIFGPTSLIVACADEAELIEVIRALEGQLTATLWLEPEDYPLALRIAPELEARAGRLVCNGWPTGVEVCPAMVHGGPYPATSDGRSSSVGTLAIERFCRPVCYQNFPTALLPAALRDAHAQQGV